MTLPSRLIRDLQVVYNNLNERLPFASLTTTHLAGVPIKKHFFPTMYLNLGALDDDSHLVLCLTATPQVGDSTECLVTSNSDFVVFKNQDGELSYLGDLQINLEQNSPPELRLVTSNSPFALATDNSQELATIESHVQGFYQAYLVANDLQNPTHQP